MRYVLLNDVPCKGLLDADCVMQIIGRHKKAIAEGKKSQVPALKKSHSGM